MKRHPVLMLLLLTLFAPPRAADAQLRNLRVYDPAETLRQHQRVLLRQIVEAYQKRITFVNNTPYPILTLRVNGVERLSSDLQPGQSIYIWTPGSGAHSLHAVAHAPWATVSVYEWNQTIYEGTTVNLREPTISEVLSNFQASTDWTGWTVDAPSQQIVIRFESNATCDAWVDGMPWFWGASYFETSSDPALLQRYVRISVAGMTVDGYYDIISEKLYLNFSNGMVRFSP